ncbi:MAG: hypothetical protein SH857_07330 [Chitinophagales bacterium]|nr:hypothetical protein [Chitinophagales bacterium]
MFAHHQIRKHTRGSSISFTKRMNEKQLSVNFSNISNQRIFIPL